MRIEAREVGELGQRHTAADGLEQQALAHRGEPGGDRIAIDDRPLPRVVVAPGERLFVKVARLAYFSIMARAMIRASLGQISMTVSGVDTG
jgi:hypothetical protein